MSHLERITQKLNKAGDRYNNSHQCNNNIKMGGSQGWNRKKINLIKFSITIIILKKLRLYPNFSTKGDKRIIKNFAKDYNISVSRLFVDAFEEKFDVNLKDFKKRI